MFLVRWIAEIFKVPGQSKEEKIHSELQLALLYSKDAKDSAKLRKPAETRHHILRIEELINQAIKLNQA